MLRFNDIADRILEYNPSCDLSLLQRAYVFSAKVHEGQERLSGEPYLVHPLEVAGILVDMRMDETTVAAGLLHDAIEDTLTDADELKRLFGEQVAFLVEGELRLVDSPRALKVRHGRRQVVVEHRAGVVDGQLVRERFDLDGLGDNLDFVRFLREHEIETIHSQEATLEDVFIEKTGRQLQ